MISFKEYLEEGRDAPLYHGTSISRVAYIINDGMIKSLTGHDGQKLLRTKDSGPRIAGVSMSRSFDYAKDWGMDVVFQFDQRKLAQKFKIIPVQFWSMAKSSRYKEMLGIRPNMSTGNEYEEFVVTKKGVPLDKFCTAIYYKRSRFHETDNLAEFARKHNIPLKDFK